MSRIHRQANAKRIRKGSAAAEWPKGKTKRDSTRTGTSANGRATTADYDKEVSRQIHALLCKEDWLKARALIKRELKLTPDSHWLWMMLGHTYYERRKYEAALAPAAKAVELQPKCPLALFYYASTLEMLDRTKEALAVYQRILDRDVEDVAYGECGEGLNRAMEIQNDCQYRMGRCYLRLGDNKAAQKSFSKYLHNRGHGVKSSYSLRKARSLLAEASQR